MERRLYVTARGIAQVDMIQLYATDDPDVFALWVNGEPTGLDVHIADINISRSNDYFPFGGNELSLKIQAKRFVLPQIAAGGST